MSVTFTLFYSFLLFLIHGTDALVSRLQSKTSFGLLVTKPIFHINIKENIWFERGVHLLVFKER